MALVFYFLCFILFQLSECQPSFTQEPNPTLYTDSGNSNPFEFIWDYNAGGLTVTSVGLSYAKDLATPFKLIARQPLVGTLQETASYTGRFTFDGKATFSLNNIKQSDSGRYECRVHFTVINPGSIASTTELTVVVRPTITFKMPSSLVLIEGDSQILRCVASGNPKPVYTWDKDSILIQDQAAGNSNYTIPSATKDDAGSYRCRASVSAPGFGPFTAEYTVDVTVQYAPKVVTISPPSDVIREGQDITLTCQADGVPTPSFSWKFNGKPFSGAQGNVVTILSAKVKDRGNYTCVANNFLGNGEATKVLNVQYAPKTTNFSTGTPNNAVLRGQKATLTCIADGFPSPGYNIQRNNQPVGTVTPGLVEIYHIQLDEEDATYSCQPSNLVGTGPRKEIKIVVQVPPSFPSYPQLPLAKQTVTEGDNQTYSCSVDAKPNATIVWLLNGQNVTDTSPYEIQTTYLAFPGNSKILRTESHLKIKGVTWTQYGTFVCLGVNDAGEVNQTTELEVRHRPVVQTLKDHPTNVTVCKGSTVTFHCKAIGNPATLEYKWQFNGDDIIGSGCSNCENTTYIKTASTLGDAGWYACLGRNLLGYGPPARAQLLINHKPEIDIVDSNQYIVNETSLVIMLCRASGVPVPEIKWTKSGNVVGYGAELKINKTSDSDHGFYRCEARNIMGYDDRSIELTVQTRPIIVSSSPMATNVGAVPGDVKELTCTVKGRPQPDLSWKNNNGNILGPKSENVKSIKREAEHAILELVVDRIGDRFYCEAVNLLGSDQQEYVIREIGKPDPPIDLKVVGIQVDNSVTVNVNVSWTPGYNGGHQQDFSVEYREVKSGRKEFLKATAGRPAGNVYTVVGLKPLTVYEFKMRAKNMLGESGETTVVRLTTPASSKQPDRGSVKATRLSEDKTVVVVTWTIQDEKVATVTLEYRLSNQQWIIVTGATNLRKDVTEFRVVNLKEDEKYEFRLDMRRPGEIVPVYVYSNEVYPVVVPKPGGRGDSGLRTEEIIAIVAGVAGPFLIFIVILCVYYFKRRKKSQGRAARKENESPYEVSDYVKEAYNNEVIMKDLDFLSGQDDNMHQDSLVAQYQTLNEATRSSDAMDAKHTIYSSPSLPLSEYHPLHPGTRSFEVPREHVTIEKIIGNGAFGQVAKGTAVELPRRPGKTDVAIKMLKAGAPQTDRKDLLSELNLMKKLKPHPYVIKLLGCVTNTEPLLVLIEYVPYGDLLGYLRKSRGLSDTYFKDPDVKPKTNLTPQQLLKFAWQIADGMSYLSSKAIIHRDLAARNVLVGERETCKVTDFGMARDVHQEDIYQRKTKGRLPVKWTAYEALLYGRYSTKSDVWSYGVVLYEIFTIGGSPYPRTDGRKIAELLQQQYRMPQPKHVDDLLYQIMLQCWQNDPDFRPTFEELREELKDMEKQQKRVINMRMYDKQMYANIEDLAE